jgi:hypothetical protein
MSPDLPHAEEWPWSSVRAHLPGEDDGLVSLRPVLDRWPTFRDLLLEDCEENFISLREAEGIERPLGTADFVTELERRLGRPIARRAPGRKAVAIPAGEQLNLLQQAGCHHVSRHRINPSIPYNVPVYPGALSPSQACPSQALTHGSAKITTS